MKKLLSLLLAAVLLLTCTGGMTAYAASNLSTGETVTVTVPRGGVATMTFTPEKTGVYSFTSDTEDYDPMCSVSLDGEDVAFNDDVLYDMETEEGDLNFQVIAILEAGNTYTLTVELYDDAAASFDVSAAFLGEVTDVSFTPAEDYTYIDGTEVYSFSFHKGDTLSLTVDGKKTDYVYDDEGFADAAGNYLEDAYQTTVFLTPLFEEDESEAYDAAPANFLNKVEISFFHYTFEVDTVTLANPVKSISYRLAKPIIVVKNLTGDWDYDAKGTKYFYYYPDFLNNGDVLTVNYTNNKVDKFTCSLDTYDDDGYEEILVNFENAKGEPLNYEYLDYYDLQFDSHWKVGTNYIYLSYMGKECKVPVQVIEAGWYKSGTKWYYYDTTNGDMVTGWKKISGKWYYFNASGVMQTGWQKIGGKWYYFNASGAMLTGWQKLGGKWYYLNASGAMLTGWQKLSGKWYYFNGSGAMVTGWQKIGSSWYYFNAGGDMKTGWLKQGGSWYYLKSSGAMATGRTIVGSKTYYFNASGVCTNP